MQRDERNGSGKECRRNGRRKIKVVKTHTQKKVRTIEELPKRIKEIKKRGKDKTKARECNVKREKKMT